VHIPLNELRDRQDSLPRDKDIHVFCAVGARAYNAVRLLQNLGFRASLLSGGEQTFSQLDSCHTDIESCQQDRDQMDHLLSWEVMRDNLPKDIEDIADELALLRDPKVFINLPIENIAEAFRRMEAVAVKKGETVMEQGDPGEYFYIIKQGQAEVWQKGLYDNEQQNVAQLEVGDHFGEEALIISGTRNASVKMISDSILLRLSGDDFMALISKPTMEEIDAKGAQSLIEKDHKILDVRYEEEYDEKHIPDVQLIPLPELRNRLDELDSKQKYLTVCLSGKRSAVATMILKQNKFDAVSLQDGLRDWPGEMISEY
jgi:rhodanese-related sulfurtransferase